MMCQSTHPLAAIGTMSWPDSGLQRRAKTLRLGLPCPLWHHPLAETAESEACVGLDLGTVRIRGHYKALD